jgi:hypothetical protein
MASLLVAILTAVYITQAQQNEDTRWGFQPDILQIILRW